MQRSALCRSRRELSNAYLLAKIGVDTAENEPLEVWGKIQFTIHFTPYLRVDVLGRSLGVLAGSLPAVLLPAVRVRVAAVRVRVVAVRVRVVIVRIRVVIVRIRVLAVRGLALVERFDVEPFSDFSAK